MREMICTERSPALVSSLWSLGNRRGVPNGRNGAMRYLVMTLLAALAGCQSAPVSQATLNARNYCFQQYGGPMSDEYEYCVYARSVGMKDYGPPGYY